MGASMSSSWPRLLKLHELPAGPLRIRLAASLDDCVPISRQLGLENLASLTADIIASPWFDGVEITGSFQAEVEQICGVTLEAFQQGVAGQILVRVVPANSPHAQVPEGNDIELDPDAPDAPDILVNDTIDISGYVVEHLALELDPFPRRPGATFEFEAPSAEMSPFAALQVLRDPKG